MENVPQDAFNRHTVILKSLSRQLKLLEPQSWLNRFNGVSVYD